ncbi:L,D-transpeptidase family protein [Roseateles sp. BYS180W]|uniref:L,D-transpeptidase family protein n=1 Tax=Roseateles rivi TaxID=3299028 RepID=A0ABW7FS23_9BURK
MSTDRSQQFLASLRQIHQPPQAQRRLKGATHPGMLVFGGLLALLGVAGLVSARVEPSDPSSPESSVQQLQKERTLLSARIEGQSPEARLMRGLQLLAKGEEDQAFEAFASLVQQQPDFALAQLIYADLLMARSGHMVSQIGSAAPLPSEHHVSLMQLRLEARQRLTALIAPPDPNTLPKVLAGLPAATRHAIVVDTSRSRLFVFENSAQGPKLIDDSYIAIGKAGTGKLLEGDFRTPLGVYFVGMPRQEAFERYGVATLPLNYPNELDRQVGRGGTSIWLHGERLGSYSRTPQSTDGCVVLPNDEMAKLAKTVLPRETPVFVLDHVEWVDRAKAKPELAPAFLTAFRGWQQAKLRQDGQALLQYYEAGLDRGSDSEASRLTANVQRMQRGELPVQNVEATSMLPWAEAGQPQSVIVTYHEFTPDSAQPKLKRQYWRERGGQWRLFFDGAVG